MSAGTCRSIDAPGVSGAAVAKIVAFAGTDADAMVAARCLDAGIRGPAGAERAALAWDQAVVDRRGEPGLSSNLATSEAWQLTLWSQEPALLYPEMRGVLVNGAEERI